MNTLNPRMRQLTGLFLLVVAIAVPLFLLSIAGTHAFIIGITPMATLITIAALLLSGRLPDRSRHQ